MTTDDQIINRRDGVDAYGLYLDYVMYNVDTGQVEQQFRYFLVDNLLCKYVRDAGNKRAAWNTYHFSAFEGAREALENAVAALPVNVEQLYKPLVVELTPSDITQIAKKDAPVARFTGTATVEKHLGKLNDLEWRPTGWAGS